jgi:isopentenyldiphosphate isomerase
MEELAVVDDKDKVIGKAEFWEAHTKGLRHRSIHIFVFDNPDLKTMLVVRRSKNIGLYPLLLSTSSSGHVAAGKSYEEAALEELSEELFSDQDLPAGLRLHKLGMFRNDGETNNYENSCLFYTIFSGPFKPDPKEIVEMNWMGLQALQKDMLANPDKYTIAFQNAMNAYKKLKRSRCY